LHFAPASIVSQSTPDEAHTPNGRASARYPPEPVAGVGDFDRIEPKSRWPPLPKWGILNGQYLRPIPVHTVGYISGWFSDQSQSSDGSLFGRFPFPVRSQPSLSNSVSKRSSFLTPIREFNKWEVLRSVAVLSNLYRKITLRWGILKWPQVGDFGWPSGEKTHDMLKEKMKGGDAYDLSWFGRGWSI